MKAPSGYTFVQTEEAVIIQDHAGIKLAKVETEEQAQVLCKQYESGKLNPYRQLLGV